MKSTMMFESQFPSGVDGGSTRKNRWSTVPLNTITIATGDKIIASLGQSQIKIYPGNYWIETAVTFYKCLEPHIRVESITNNITLRSTISEFSNIIHRGEYLYYRYLKFECFIGQPDLIELQYFTKTSNPKGLGVALGFDGVEVYSKLIIRET